jgi:hypothetical protein
MIAPFEFFSFSILNDPYDPCQALLPKPGRASEEPKILPYFSKFCNGQKGTKAGIELAVKA